MISFLASPSSLFALEKIHSNHYYEKVKNTNQVIDLLG